MAISDPEEVAPKPDDAAFLHRGALAVDAVIAVHHPRAPSARVAAARLPKWGQAVAFDNRRHCPSYSIR